MPHDSITRSDGGGGGYMQPLLVCNPARRVATFAVGLIVSKFPGEISPGCRKAKMFFAQYTGSPDSSILLLLDSSLSGAIDHSST